jgi:tight adherence protein C
MIISVLAFFIADDSNLSSRFILYKSLNVGDRKSIESRLAQIGKSGERHFENFRIAQLVYIAGMLAGITVFFILGIIETALFLLLLISIPALVHLITERTLTQKVQLRRRDVESEFPAIVEMLTLAIGAGESPAAAFKRITQRAHGYLAEDFARVVKEVEAGTSFLQSLDAMSKRLSSDSLRRFVDSIIISMSRGTPLVEILTHAAKESRNQERVRLLGAAGKSELSMMIPVVFLILPISIVFALFPSLTNLNLFSN